MKNGKRILAVLSVVAVVASCFTGCGAKSEKTTKGGGKEIEIAYWNSGLSTDWLDAMVAAFEKKYPEYKVTYTATASQSAVIAPFGKPDSDTIDLYMAAAQYDTTYTEPLDDVLDSKIDGESKTIREKFDASYVDLETAADGKVHELTYGGGALGFVYNKKMFEEAGIKTLPRTTDELVIACDTLAEAGIVPICHFAGADYWNYMSDAWRMQYDGRDYFVNNFYGCTDENGNSPSKEVFTKEDGRYEVLKVCEKIITPDYVLSGSNTHHITTIQTMFLQGECAMMITGAWAANEMASVGAMDDFSVMKTPVISSILNNLTTVTKEKELREVISAVDAVTDGEKELSEFQDGENYNVDGLSVSAADWECIRKARNTVPMNYTGETMFIPNYSDAKEGAKEFMKFMFSDEGYKVYTDTLHIALPITPDEGTLDVSKWNSFEQAMYNLTMSAEQNATRYIKSEHKIFYVGGADAYAGVNTFGKFCANNANDRLNADSAWEQIQKQVNVLYEATWLANIGE